MLDCYEYEEEDLSEGRQRRVSGPLINTPMTRMLNSPGGRTRSTIAAISKKAGLRGTGKLSTHDLRAKPKDYTTYDSEYEDEDYGSTAQDHYIRTYKSARRAAAGEGLIRKRKPAGRTQSGMTKLKVAPSSESVRKVKDFRKQIVKSGANKTGPAHVVSVMHRDSEIGKGDRHQRMERSRNFIQALKDTSKHLKKTGAKKAGDVIKLPKKPGAKPVLVRKGHIIMGLPTGVMHGEDKEIGAAKRGKLYSKIFGKKAMKRSQKTGLMVGAMR
jgi:hypothetical protein